ncbi:MAG: IS110 family transposase [Verrucomicrobiota bacterium]|nr:IS110 family transposase [Verrucomicrobiota bacterium]
MNPAIYDIVAIDVSKDTLEVLTDKKSMTLPNNDAGIDRLIKAIAGKPNPFVALEATGGYERRVCERLHEAGIALSLINPARVRAFARSEGIMAKTDPIDTAVIGRFAKEKELRPTPAPSAEQQELIDLMDRRSQMAEQLGTEKTRLKQAPDSIRRYVQDTIHATACQIQELETAIDQVIQRDPAMKHAFQVFVSVKGVGEVTAWSILAYLREIGEIKRSSLVALAGLAPFNRDSGKTKKPRRIQGGRAKVRTCLYMAAQTAARCNPVIKPYVEGLRERGKPYKCALVAAMRKLLIHLQSLLKNSTPELDS